MARKKKELLAPDPECEVAMNRIVATAHACAAALFGEAPTADPTNDASPRALLSAMGMIYFLLRLPPEDLRTLASDTTLAALPWQPSPPGGVKFKGPFAAFLTAH